MFTARDVVALMPAPCMVSRDDGEVIVAESGRDGRTLRLTMTPDPKRLAWRKAFSVWADFGVLEAGGDVFATVRELIRWLNHGD